MEVTTKEIIKRIEQELSKASWIMDLSTHGDFSATIFGIKVIRSNPRSDDCDQVGIESAYNPRIVMTMWEDERRLGYPENDVVSAARDAVLAEKRDHQEGLSGISLTLSYKEPAKLSPLERSISNGDFL